MTTRFLHLTDLHISHPDVNDTTLDTDTVATLDRVLTRIAGIEPAPDFIVVSGDLTNRGHAESYELLAEMMARTEIPVFYALGNHDRREGFRSVFTGYAGGLTDPLDHDAVIAGTHLITLETAEPGRVGGRIQDSQFAFLAEALARHPELPKLLVLHHMPRLSPEAIDWAALPQTDTDRLGEMLQGANIAGILSGHVHYNRAAVWNGIPLIVTNGQHATVDLLARDEVCVIEGTGLALCELLPGGLCATFMPIDTGPVLRRVSLERLQELA